MNMIDPEIDEEQINSLKEIDSPDKELLRELISLFRHSAEERISKMENALVEKDFKVIHREAHTFKSTCYNVGATQLARICQSLETLASTKTPAVEELSGYMLALREIFPQTSKKLDQYLYK